MIFATTTPIVPASEALAFQIGGTVYHDLDANGAFDPGEPGVGEVWVKLLSGGVVIGAVEPDFDTGAYAFPGLSDGAYSLVIDDNGLASDTTPTAPFNWAFQNPRSGSLAVAVSGGGVDGQDFGLTYQFAPAANCECGYEDGILTQRSIAIDGDMSDWGAIFRDGDNVGCDPSDEADRDHPVQSTGRNMLRVAATFDATHFSMFTERIGSSNNTQNFLYYADSDADGIMEDGEPVVVAEWQGNTGDVTFGLWAYDDLGSGGDPLVDSAGFVDGYSMPGDLTFVKALPDADARGATEGPEAGTQLEWTIRWTELGIEPGSAISWHVSSTNSSPGSSGLGTKIDDNLGGCGGRCTGSNQFGGVDLQPGGIVPGGITYLSHGVTNAGNGNDTFNVLSTSSGAWAPVSIAHYLDVGTVGTYDPGEDTLLVDTDSDGIVDTGPLAAGEGIGILVAVELPGAPALGTTLVETTATSTFLHSCGQTGGPASDTVQEEITIHEDARIGIAKQGTVSGNAVTVDLYLENLGSVDLGSLSLTDDLDATFGAGNYTIVTAPRLVDDPGTITLESGFTGSPPGSELIAGGSTLAVGVTAQIQFQVAVTTVVDSGLGMGVYSNQATASGNGPAGTTTSDASDAGTDPDPDGDGNPDEPGENDPTVMGMTESPVIGVAKQAGSIVDNGDGTFDVPIMLTLENLGSVMLFDVQVTDVLTDTFPAPATFGIASPPTSPTLDVNAGYDGETNPSLLTGSDSLAAGETATVSFRVRVSANGNIGPFFNSATATARDGAGNASTDLSEDGVDPDPNGNGNPNEGDENDPTPIPFTPVNAVVLTKEVSRPEASPGDMLTYVLELENTTGATLTDLTLSDQIPAGFSYVEGSARLLISGEAAADVGATGQRPVVFGPITLQPTETLHLRYQLRIGASVRAGEYVNRATPLGPDGPVGNTARASVRVVADTLLQKTFVIGKIFHDRDADGWQDSADATRVTFQGGVRPEFYVPGSTTVDRGDGPEPVPDEDGISPLVRGLDVGTLTGRESGADPVENHRVVIRAKLREALVVPVRVTSREGTRMRLAPGEEPQHDAPTQEQKKTTAQELIGRVEVNQVDGAAELTIVLSNRGVHEEGVPGVRIGTALGLLVETDAHGRFHLADLDAQRWGRGRNFILKVDPATLPGGTSFTTENPRVMQLTPGLVTKVNFGVQLPVLSVPEKMVSVKLGEVFFETDEDAIRPESRSVIDQMAEQLRRYGRGEILIEGHANEKRGAEDNRDLALRRAQSVRRALEERLGSGRMKHVEIRVERGEVPRVEERQRE